MGIRKNKPLFSLDAFKRKSSQRFIPEIDALRFFAIIPVMLVHLSGALLTQNNSFDRGLIDSENFFRQILLQGNFGVHLFFAISGFILTLPFLRKKKGHVNLKKYFTRRLVRIEPPYIIAITVFLLVHIVLNEQNITFLINRYIASFFYVHNFLYESGSYILPVAWSLEIEIQFYLLMPLLMFIVKLNKSYLWRIFIYSILLYFSVFIDLFAFSELNDFMVFFLAGIISADLYVNKKFEKRYYWDFLFTIAMLLFFGINDKLSRFVFLIIIITSSFHLVYLKKMIQNKYVVIIGGMCYSLYLLHYPLYQLLMKIFSNYLTIANSFELSYLLQATIFIPISIVMMGVYFILVEKPFMVLSQKLGGKKN